MTQISTIRPASEKERQVGVDALRGFALFLILFVNLEFLSQTIDEGWVRPQFDGALDQAARWLLVAFFQLKSYLIFSLLFGYGLAIQLGRGGTNAGFGSRYLRRMAGLFALGLLHGVFFFSGDTLMCYAILGSLLVAFRRAATRTLLRAAAIAYGVGLAVLLLLPLDAADTRSNVAAIRGVFADGSFLAVAGQRTEDLVIAQGFSVLVQWPSVFAFFLIGLALGRANAFGQPTSHVVLFRRLTLGALPVGLAGGATAASLGLAYGWNDGGAFLVQAISGPASALGYVGAFGLLLARGRAGTAVRLAAPVGRMSLSVYLGESILASLIFNGYGLGLFGSVGPFAGLLLAIGIWVAFVPFDRLWLSRYRFGPFEWLLRSWTYLTPQPMRRRVEKERSAGAT